MTSFALVRSSSADFGENEIFIPKEYDLGEKFESKKICLKCGEQMNVIVSRNFVYGSCCKKLFIIMKSCDFYFYQSKFIGL